VALPEADRSFLQHIVPFEKGEGAAVVWSCAYFFFLLSSYYVIRPLRDAMGVARSDETLTWLYMGTLLGTLIANPIFSFLVSRFPRRVFLPVVYHVLALCLVTFWALLRFLPPEGAKAVAGVFFVWASVFNLFAVSVFWGFMADLYRSDQGKRLFGFIGVGGTLGALAGAQLTKSLAAPLGPVNLVLGAALILEAAVFCMRRLLRLFHVDEESSRDPGRPPGRGVLEGIRLVSKSPYLLGICLFLLLYSISSTFLYFEQARIVRAAFTDPAAKTAYFANIDFWANLVTAITQVLLTGRILSRLGITTGLSALPAVTAGALAAVAAAPTAAMMTIVQVVRRSTEFAVVRPSREVLYTVTTREEKYASKSLIDTFVYRGGDAIGAWTDQLLKALNVAMGTLAAIFVPVAVGWVALAAFLGRRQRALAGDVPLSAKR
jgi:AAA family ATP:ADP antiporter